MNLSKDLWLALLSLDSYNRGYGAGLADGQGQKDDDGNDTDGLGEAGSMLGGASVLDVDLPNGSQAAGFYAIAYDVPDIGRVIAYRGTDDTSSLTPDNDIVRGWIVGAGAWQATTASYAQQFYDNAKPDGIGSAALRNSG